MSTKQLTLLWYGTLILLVLSLAGVQTTLTLSIAGVLFLLLLIYSLGHHHRANRKKLVVMIFLPMLLFGIGAFVFDALIQYSPAISPDRLKNISANEVEMLNTKLQHQWFSDVLSGSIQNNSPFTLESLSLQISLTSPRGVVETKHLHLSSLQIPPGQRIDFHKSFGDYRLHLPQSLTWSLQVMGGMGI